MPTLRRWRSAIARFEPEVVYHLAALSSVGRSWEEPGQTLSANLGGAVSLLSAIRSAAPEAHRDLGQLV